MAMVGLTEEFKALFGQVKNRCPIHGFTTTSKCLCAKAGCKNTIEKIQPLKDPIPTLFIQDELHLVKESLGTFDSHYESFLKYYAVYSFLPHMWVASRGDAQSVTAEIIGWNYLKMDNIYQNFIEGEIKRQIRLFGNRGGDISSFNINDGEHSFTIVEPAMNDTVQDITGRKSPLVFYCNSCHRAFEERNPQDIDLAHWECPNCHKSGVKQLQMIYSCECGHAEPVKIPYVRNGSKDIQYRPNDGRRGAYHMYVKNNGKEDTLELAIKCPSCGQRLTLDNAESSRNYKPFSLKIINIADTKNGEFFEKGIDAQKTLVSKWLGKLSQEKFLEILDNIPLAFSASNTNDAKRKEAEKAIDQMITAGMMPEAMREAAISKMLGVTTENALSVEPYTLVS